MYNGYSELEKLTPADYLNWEAFDTPYDTPARAIAQYQEGLAVGLKAEFITLSYKGVWGYHGKQGETCTSYEGIGYHANTKDLLHGFIDSGCPIVVYRWYPDSPITHKVISGEVTERITQYLAR